MDTDDQIFHFKLNQFVIDIVAHQDKKLCIKIIDMVDKQQFYHPCLSLCQIGTKTLTAGLSKTNKQVTIGMKVKQCKQQKQSKKVLELTTTICSQYLQMSETVEIPSTRNLRDEEVMLISINSLQQALHKVKQSNALKNPIILGSVYEDRRIFNSSDDYENLGTINLKKGRYCVTVSFFLKTQSQYQSWVYLYLNAEEMIVNGGFYTHSNQYIPYTVKKMFVVSNKEQLVNIKTYYSSAYPIFMKNFIVTAQAI